MATKTFQNIYEDVLGRMKIPTTDETALADCKRFINSRYENLAFRRKWRWRKKRWDLKIESKYITGTLSVTNGSRQMTGVGTAFTANHVNWFIEVSGRDEVLEILAIDTGTQVLTMSSEFTGTTSASVGYKAYKNEYGLPPDCEEIDLVWHDHYKNPIDIASPYDVFNAIISNPGQEGYAKGCTVSGFKGFLGAKLDEFLLDHDFLMSTAESDNKLILYPHIPAENYTLHVMYIRTLTTLVNDSDEPWLPVEKRHVLCWGAYADMLYRERLDDTAGTWDAKYELLVKEIESDDEYTEDRPQLIVGGSWWRRQRTISPSDGDLGTLFGEYTPYD